MKGLSRRTFLKSLGVIVGALLVAPWCIFSKPKTVFVSMDGNDSWPGTFNKPMRSISAAVSRANPEDTINVLPGKYINEGNFTMKPHQKLIIGNIDESTYFTQIG